MKRRKVIVIGVDCAEPSIVNRLVRAGKLPAISQLIRRGTLGTIQSTIPSITPPAWETLVTGVNPGQHGIFDFIKMTSDYQARPVESQDSHGLRIWEYLSSQKKKSIVLNYPIGFPPDKVRGIFVSGRGVSSLRQNFTYPKDFRRKILRTFPNYQIDVDKKYLEQNRPDLFLKSAYSELEMKGKLAADLIKNNDWDFFMVVLMTLDRVQHFLFHQEEVVEAFYQKIDEVIGKLLETVDWQTTSVILVSDHGIGQIQRKINLNYFLVKLGLLSHRQPSLLKKWLSGKGEVKTEKKIDWSKTKAFLSSVAAQSLRINLARREQEGIVPKREYQAVRKDIMNQLKQIKDGKRRVVGRLFGREEIFSGPNLKNADDIFLTLKSGYALEKKFSGAPFSNVSFEKMGRVAEHLPRGILIVAGGGLKSGTRFEKVKMVDVFPTICDLIRVRVPSFVEGKSLAKGNLHTNVYILGKASSIKRKSRTHRLTEKQARRKIMAELKALGYW